MKTLLCLFTFNLIFFINVLHAQPTIEWQRCLGDTLTQSSSAILQTDDGGFVILGLTESNTFPVINFDLSITKINSAGDIEWRNSFGGECTEVDITIKKSPDAGYIIAAYTCSTVGDVIGYHSSSGFSEPDIWIIKINSEGNIEWQKCLGGSSNDYFSQFEIINDGSILLGGSTESNNGDVSGNHGSFDIWLVKLSNTGNVIWQKCFGGSGYDELRSYYLDQNGNIICSGKTNSNDGDVIGNHGDDDFWLFKINPVGEIIWQKCIGGTAKDELFNFVEDSDKGFVLFGITASNDGDVSGNQGGNVDGWICKTDSTGTLEWQNCLGGTSFELINQVKNLGEDGFLVIGYTNSNDGDVTGYHGGYDAWIIKLDIHGNLMWQKCLGGANDDFLNQINFYPDGNILLGGGTNSNDGDVAGNHGAGDIWLVKLSSTGNLIWQKCIGGSDFEGGSIHQTNDGGYIITGRTNSNDGDVSGNYGGGDAWVVKLSPVITESAAFSVNSGSLQISPNPVTGKTNLKARSEFLGKAYRIFNALGREVMSGQISAEEMPLSTESLPPGIYSIHAAGQAVRMVKE